MRRSTGWAVSSAEGDSPVERGQYLVTITGCNDCHTPFKMGANGPEPDMTRQLSGHPAALKMPPPPTFGAEWAWGGAATNTAPIQPPMPWPWYGKMTDEDLKATFAYLRSIPAIANEVPPWAPAAGK